MNDLTRNLLLWMVVAVVLMVVFQSFSPRSGGMGAAAPTYSQFLDEVDAGIGGAAAALMQGREDFQQ